MEKKNPTIRNASDVSRFLQSMRDALQRRNADLRTLGHGKALHVYAEAKGYENWQQCHAALIKSEFIETQMNRFRMDEAHAEQAWGRLSSEEIKNAEDGESLAEYFAWNYPIVPIPRKKDDENVDKSVRVNVLKARKGGGNIKLHWPSKPNRFLEPSDKD